MSYSIHNGKKGTTLRASGKDAQELFDAMTRQSEQQPIEEIKAWRFEANGEVYLRLTNDAFDKPDIWYVGTLHGFSLIGDVSADKLESLFQAAQEPK